MNNQPVPLILPTPSGYNIARGIEHFLQSKYLPERPVPLVDADLWVPTRFRVFGDTGRIVELQRHLRGADIYVVGDVQSQATIVPDFKRVIHLGHDITLWKDAYRVTDNKGSSLETRSTKLPIDQNFMDLLRTIEAARNAGKERTRITAVLPFFPYSRQDRRGGRYSLDSKLATTLLEASGVNHILTLDVHNPSAMESAVNAPMFVDQMTATYTFLGVLRAHPEWYPLENLYFVAPDSGALERNKVYAEELGCPVNYIYKRRDRSKANVVDGMFGFAGDPKGLESKDVILVDDMIDSGGTLIQAAEYLRSLRVHSVTAVTTHPVFSYPAFERLDDAYARGLLTRVFATNAVTLKSRDWDKYRDWLCPVDITKYFAKAIDRLNRDESISELLKETG